MVYEGPPFGWSVPPGYDFDNLGTCRSCGAAIAWCYTPKGNRAPINPDGINHIATCPSAADHRRPKPKPPPVFEGPTARGTDPGTSYQAARDALPRAGTNRRLAYEALLAAGPSGLTDFELADRTGIAQTSIGVRRKELVRAGYAEATPRRRPAPSGSAAIVWRAITYQEDPT